MIQKIKGWVLSHEIIFLALLVVVFVLIRLPATDFPLHQDEYKWPTAVNPAYQEVAGHPTIPHPPLGELIYKTAGYIVGFNIHFRFVPLFFGTLNLLLLYYFVRFAYGKKEAFIASLAWTLSYFSILASIMVDTDGEIMPFFFLLALIGYFKSKQTMGKEKRKWLVLLFVALLGGFLIKISFLLAIGAIIADFLWSKKDTVSRKDLMRYMIKLGLGIISLFVLLIISAKVFSFFDLSQSVTYWEHFFVLQRGWMQTAIQCAKAILYASPFLVLIPLFDIKKVWEKTRVFVFFLLFAFLFYVVMFDFSIGALDRYLQLLILPLSVMSSVVIVSILHTYESKTKKFLWVGVGVVAVIVLVQFLPHYVPPLHPKAEWISRILSLKWNFVYPFSGGSGPLGFYVSFFSIGLAWAFSLGALVAALWKRNLRIACLLLIIPIGIAYNGIFAEEYLIGAVNGSAPRLLTEAVEYIKNNPDIKMVTVYNDNGGKEIQDIGKYRKRLYVDPMFDVKEKLATLNMYKEHYFVLDIPRVNSDTIYQKYFNSCKVIYGKSDEKISATVYDCRGIPDVKL